MHAGVLVCVALALLCSSCWGLPFSSPLLSDRAPSAVAILQADTHSPAEPGPRHRRSALQLKALDEEDAEPRANLSELLARLISTKKDAVRRNSSANNRGGVLRSNHRIADRDYLGWMDFGRRSAEEYEYSS